MKLFNFLFNFFFRKDFADNNSKGNKKKQNTPQIRVIILEPILTPSGLLDAGDDAPDPVLLDVNLDINQVDDTFDVQVHHVEALDVEANYSVTDIEIPDADLEPVEFFTVENSDILPAVANPEPTFDFDSGVFTVGETGEVEIDFLFDGGGYKGELAIFSLDGMDGFEPGSQEFIQEAAQRGLSSSELGHVVIFDSTEGARFSANLDWEGNLNSGEYQGVKAFSMRPGDEFGFMLVPNGRVEEVFNNPGVDGAVRPLFSLATANPNDAFHVGQIADVTGDGNTFALEDLRLDGNSDKDYNDIVFQVRGATGKAGLLDDVINSGRDWRDTEIGKALVDYAETYVMPDVDHVEVIIDNPSDGNLDINPEPIDDFIGNDIADLADDVDGIDDVDVTDDVEVIDDVDVTDGVEVIDDVDVTDGTVVEIPGTTEEIEIVDSSIISQFEFPKENQPLIGIIDTGFSGDNPDIDYSRIILGQDRVDGDANPLLASGEGNEHGTHVLGVIAATQNNDVGIDGINDDAPVWVGQAIGSGKLADSVVEFVDVAKASEQPNAVLNLSLDLTQVNPDGSVTTRYEFTPAERAAIEYARQNGVLIVVAAGNDGGVMSALGQASQEFDNIITVGAADGLGKAGYSSYGDGLDILAVGGTNEKPVISTTGDGVGAMAGTSVAAAKVTGAASQVWAVNPQLSYRQVIEILKSTATDLQTPGWDAETGTGLLNMAAAVSVAQKTMPEAYKPEAFLTPTTWGGEGQVTPGERAVAVEFNGKYYDWEAYKIRSGDTLSGIALRTMGNGTAPYYNFIAQKNGIANPNFIYAGQTIYIPKQVAPPTVNLNNTVGYDGTSTHQTYINTFNRNGGSSALGSPINNVHPWGNGYTQDFSGGSESKGAIMKSNANDNSYWVGADFWTKFLDTGGSGGILGYPTSDRYSTSGGQRQNFQGGAIIKSSQGIFPLFGGIGAHYLNNEGGEKGRLGFPTSGEIGIGNGVIVQNFENGRIVYGDGATRTEMNNQPSPPPPTSTTINGYRVDGNFYPVYINYRGTIGNPISGVINYSNGVSYQLFERGSIVSSQYGTFPIYGGIRQTYLNTGGLNGWLGAPKSAEIGQGNGVIIQYFANGYIIWNGSRATAYRDGSGVPSQPVPNPQPVNNIKLKNFRGWVMPGIGVALRNSPRLNDKSGKAEPYGKWLDFDAWTYGDTVNDYKVGTPDNRWFRVKGTNYWVPSAYIYGYPEGLPGNETPGSGSSGANNNQPITSYADYLKRLYGGSPSVISVYPKPSHNAIDSVHQGSAPHKVYSLTNGVVKFIGKDQYGGNYVQIWNSELQRYFYYVHFASFNPALRVGQQIQAGDYIGNEGSTGNSTGRHTHVHVTLPDGRTKVDPLSALGSYSSNLQPQPQPTPGNSNITWVNFSGTVGPSIGVNLRNSTSFADRSSRNEPNGKRLEFDAWAYGETGTDMWTGQPDARWFKVKGTNLWVPSAYINGNPPNSSSMPGGSSVGNVQIITEPINSPSDPNGSLGTADTLGSITSDITLNGKIGYSESYGRDDNDYYKFHVDKTSRINLGLDGLFGDADIQLLNSNGQMIVSSSRISTNVEAITHELYPGDYYVRIQPYKSATTPYNLRLVNLSGDIKNGDQSYDYGANLWRYDTNGIIRQGAVSSAIESNKDTIVVIHGWNKDGGSLVGDNTIESLAKTAAKAYPNHQVLVLDWKNPAHDKRDGTNFWDVPWNTAGAIAPVAAWAKNALEKIGLTSQRISLFGHSLGTYVSAEIGRLFGKVNSIVALDPAASGPNSGGDKYDIDGNTSGLQTVQNFRDVARNSVAFVASDAGGGLAGDNDRAATAQDSFIVNFDQWVYGGKDGEYHGGVVQVFTDMLDKKMVDLQGYKTDSIANNGSEHGSHEGIINAKKDNDIWKYDQLKGIPGSDNATWV
jgi:pimeloyl-ACP methyl ester carboxylesterase